MQPIYLKIPETPDRWRFDPPPDESPPEPETAIPGLDVPPPKPDQTMMRYKNAADLTVAVQNWKAATRDLLHGQYFTTRSGPDAANAVPDALEFHKEWYERSLAACGDDPDALHHLRVEGDRIVNNSLTYMEAFAKEENKRYVNATLKNEEDALRQTMASAFTTPGMRDREFKEYVAKAENWKLS